MIEFLPGFVIGSVGMFLALNGTLIAVPFMLLGVVLIGWAACD